MPDTPALHGELVEFTPGLIYAKLIEAARLMEGVEKGGFNKAQGFKFRGIEQLTAACAPIFKEVGIVVLPSMRVVDSEESGGKGRKILVEATYTFYAEDGSSVSATTIGEGADSYDKATNKAMSAAFKYALLQTFCIGDPDDDGDSQAPPKAAPARTKAPEVAAKDWAAWETTRSQIVADDTLKGEFTDWVLAQDYKVDRSMSAAHFAEVVGKAHELLGTADPEEAPFE